MHLKVNACHPYPRNDLFLILGSYRISIQDLIADSSFFCFFCFYCFSCFSCFFIKSSQLGNWELLFPTHPPLVFLHFLGLSCFFHFLDKSIMIFLTHEVLDRFGKCFIHLWGLLYFGKSTFLSFMSCLHTTRFYYERCTIYVHYYSSLFNGRIHTNTHLFIHVIQSLFFSLVFLCMLVRILNSKIYFLCFFLEFFLIELKPLFLHGIRAERLINFYIVEERSQSPIPLWRRACLAYKIFS